MVRPIPPFYENDPANGDELYEVYRTGLITRHICLNGRVDGITWLGRFPQMARVQENLALRIEENRRKRVEEWMASTADRIIRRREARHWWPLPTSPITENKWSHKYSDYNVLQINIVPESWGGEDNPLVTSGLALAIFSLESLQDIGGGTYSLDYARQIFRFFQQSEIGNSGCLMRSRGFKAPEFATRQLASTDEMMGVFVGLVFYYKACLKARYDKEVDLIKSLVLRIAENMGRHGYWCLPPADIFRSFKPTHFLIERHHSWVFAYAFRKFFEFVLVDKVPSRSWDQKEFDAYFNGIWSIVTEKLVELSPLVEMLGVESGSLQFTPAIIDDPGMREVAVTTQALPIDSLDFFMAVIGLIIPEYLAYYEKDSAYIEFLRGTGVGVLMPQKDNYYNYHMGALALILALEVAADDKNEVQRLARLAMQALIGTPKHPRRGKDNALFGVLLLGSTGDEESNSPWTTLARQSIEKLDAKPEWWQHDLPLGDVKFLTALELHSQPEALENLLKSDSAANKDPSSWDIYNGIIGWLDNEYPPGGAIDWRGRISMLPRRHNYNPDDRGGEWRTWEHLSHVFTKTWSIERLANSESPGYKEVLHLLVEQGAEEIVVEGAGLGLIFPRILAAHYGVLEKPTLSSDEKWSTLPYIGALPDYAGCDAGVSIKESRAFEWRGRRHTEKVLVGLAKNGKRLTRRPSDLFWDVDGIILYHAKPFRGARRYHYTSDLPFGLMGWVRGQWEWYVEIAQTRAELKSIPADQWNPHDADRDSGGVNILQVGPYRERVPDWLGKAALVKRDWLERMWTWQDNIWHQMIKPPRPTDPMTIFSWFNPFVSPLDKDLSLIPYPRANFQMFDVWDFNRLPLGRQATGSFLFYRVKLHLLDISHRNTSLMDLRDSVGNENLCFVTNVRPFWRRYNSLDGLENFRYIYNPHGCVIHDLRTPHKRHLDQLKKAFNILALPIPEDMDLAQLTTDELVLVISRIFTTGTTGHTDLSLEQLKTVRRDHYWIDETEFTGNYYPPNRLRKYLETHPTAKARYEHRNLRRVQLCSWCSHG